MKKTVEIEYVGIEDAQDILDDAYALIKEGHYVNFSMSNLCDDKGYVSIMIMLDGFTGGKDYDYEFRFYLTDNADDVAKMNECKGVLKNLLVEE